MTTTPQQTTAEFKSAFEAGIAAMRIALRADYLPDDRIERITKRARYIYSCAALECGSQKLTDTTPDYFRG